MEIKHIGNGQYTVKMPGETFSIQSGDTHTQPLLDMLRGSDDIAKEAFVNNAKTKGIAKAVREFCNIPEPAARKTDEEMVEERAKEYAALTAQGKHEEAYYALHGIEKPKTKKE